VRPSSLVGAIAGDRHLDVSSRSREPDISEKPDPLARDARHIAIAIGPPVVADPYSRTRLSPSTTAPAPAWQVPHVVRRIVSSGMGEGFILAASVMSFTRRSHAWRGTDLSLTIQPASCGTFPCRGRECVSD
jgi:hypothetical protein